MSRTVIVGGGISGLSTAYYLAKAGVPSILVERRGRLGGVIQTEWVSGCLIEAGPDSFLSSKPWAAELIREVGLGAELIGSNDELRETFVVKGGKLRLLPDGLMLMVPTRIAPVVMTPLLGWKTKLRVALELLRRPNAAGEEDRTVADFVRDHYGPEAVDYLAEPLLAGVYGGDPERLSAHSVLPLFVELERKYGSLSRGLLAQRRDEQKKTGSLPLFQTLKRGLGSLIDRLEEVTKSAVKLIRDEAIGLERRATGFRLRMLGGELECEDLVLACQANEAARLLYGVDEVLGELLGSVPYHSSVTVTLGYRKEEVGRRLRGFGFLVPKVERQRLVACTFVGTKFSHREAEGFTLLRCFMGGTDEWGVGASDEEVSAQTQAELKRLIGLTAQPAFVRIYRWPRSMAQYVVGHRRRMKAVEERCRAIKGLYLAGNAYTGIGVPDCVRMGRAAAEEIVKHRFSSRG